MRPQVVAMIEEVAVLSGHDNDGKLSFRDFMACIHCADAPLLQVSATSCISPPRAAYVLATSHRRIHQELFFRNRLLASSPFLSILSHLSAPRSFTFD